MLGSRGIPALKALRLLANRTQPTNAIRKSHDWSYRTAPAPPAKIVIQTAEFVAAVAWWWVLWHLWTEPGHVIGEFEYPDASKWTDEELGIPSD